MGLLYGQVKGCLYDILANIASGPQQPSRLSHTRTRKGQATAGWDTGGGGEVGFVVGAQRPGFSALVWFQAQLSHRLADSADQETPRAPSVLPRLDGCQVSECRHGWEGGAKRNGPLVSGGGGPAKPTRHAAPRCDLSRQGPPSGLFFFSHHGGTRSSCGPAARGGC